MASDDDSNITITLAANTAGVQVALSEAISSFQRMRQEMSYVSDASKLLGENVISSNRSWLEAGVAAGDYQQRLTYLKETLATAATQQDENIAALRSLTASMAEQRMEAQYLSDATRLLGAETAETNMSWLLAADNANDYGARLGYLREQLALVRQEQSGLANDLNVGFGSVGGAGSGGGFGGILSTLADIPILGNATSMFSALMGQQLFNAGYQGVSNFFSGMFDLNRQTEQNVYAWQYTYGMRPQDAVARGWTPEHLQAYNLQNAQDISAWTQQYSTNIPFTRQSLMSAVSAASRLGLDKEGLAQYMPLFADLASTQLGPTGEPLTLDQVVQAVRGEEMGYKRMMQYTVGISPEMLQPYGLAFEGHGVGGHITDTTTLLPALMKWSEAQGFTKWGNVDGKQVDQGAAFNTAHATFWGEWSSFLDRVQNFQLAGGAGLFGAFKDDLEGISKWMDENPDKVKAFAQIMNDDVGGAFKTATSALEGFGAGLHASGLDKQVLSGLQGLEKWFEDPKHQQEVKDVAGAVGSALGNLGHGIGALAGDATQIWSAFLGSGLGQDIGQYGIPALGEFYSREQNAWGGFAQSGTQFWTDLFGGDLNDASKQLTHNLQDLSSVITFGVIPAYQDGKTVTEHMPDLPHHHPKHSGGIPQSPPSHYPSNDYGPDALGVIGNIIHADLTQATRYAIGAGGYYDATRQTWMHSSFDNIQNLVGAVAQFIQYQQGQKNPHASAGPAAQLVQTLHDGLGGDTGHKMGSDFVQNLASGMQTRLPIVASTSKTIGTNIAQQVMEGAMQHLGVGSGGGGVSGIGPGSTLADLVKWTVAEALQTSGNGVWSDGHTPGGFNRWGTYGFN